MWTWLLFVSVLVLLVLTASAGYMALFGSDRRRSVQAQAILKTLLTASLGSAGIVAFVLRLHQAAVL